MGVLICARCGFELRRYGHAPWCVKFYRCVLRPDRERLLHLTHMGLDAVRWRGR